MQNDVSINHIIVLQIDIFSRSLVYQTLNVMPTHVYEY